MDNLGVEGCEREFDRLLIYLTENYDEADVATKAKALCLSIRHRLPKTIYGLLKEAMHRSKEDEKLPPVSSNSIMPS